MPKTPTPAAAYRAGVMIEDAHVGLAFEYRRRAGETQRSPLRDNILESLAFRFVKQDRDQGRVIDADHMAPRSSMITCGVR